MQVLRKRPAVYIMTNKPNGTLYVGVTASLQNRVWQHRFKLVQGFTCRYNLTKLVYFEFFADLPTAIKREKQLKKWNRLWKIKLIETDNPEWKDLYEFVMN